MAERRFRSIGAILFAVFSVVAIAYTSSASAEVISIGDSYSSGEGSGSYDGNTKLAPLGDGCHRSPNAWPRLLGATEETHLACSGATTYNFFLPQKPNDNQAGDAYSQLARLKYLVANSPISTVYATFGGNDIGFADIIKDCYLNIRTSCLGRMGSVEIPKIQKDMRNAVATVLAAAKKESGGANVVLVGYPDIVPAPGRPEDCGWLDTTEKRRVADLEYELDTALSRAAEAAGVAYVSIRSALKGHELCTRNSWMVPIVSFHNSPLSPQQGHPNARGQEAIADAVSLKMESGAGVVPSPPADCQPAGNVAAIIDDSSSMLDSDPFNLRSSAMQLLTTKPSGQLRTLGAVEFGTEAGQMFPPTQIAAGQAWMLGALNLIQGDGANGAGDRTNYNAAFALSGQVQSNAKARIFFTDGGHNEGDYLNYHQGGPRTYVVGLGIGSGGEGDDDADLLRRIANDTGGYYFPLPESEFSNEGRIQPVFNAIDSLLQCRKVPSQAMRTLTPRHRTSSRIASSFFGADALEVVITWNNPTVRMKMAGAAVRSTSGKIIANLGGRTVRKHARGKKHFVKVAKLQPSTVGGTNYTTVTMPRPEGGSNLSVTIKSSKLKKPTNVSVQIGPVPGTPVTPPIDPIDPGPPAPVTFMEQETPNHPVNTFQNYHNASGMGPAIAAGQWVEVSCRVYDPTIASVNPDGYWYRIASAPWNNAYYSPANTFMNGDPYGGPYTHNTDFNVPVC